MKNSNYCCHVNTKLVPFKIHFFFAYAAYAGVLPFMPVIAKQLNIPATAVGIGISMVPVFITLSNPITGFLVDYFQSLKVFLIVLLIISCSAYSFILSLPPISTENENLAYAEISDYNVSEILIDIPGPLERTCLEKVSRKEILCELEFEQEIDSNDSNVATYLTSSISVIHNVNTSYAIKKGPLGKYWTTTTFYSENISFSEMKDLANSIKSLKCLPSIQQCSVSTDTTSVFSTYQFWTFFTLIVIGGMTSSSLMNLSSVACYEILGTQIEYYGRQRLFGTISWGLVCPLAGILNDFLTSDEKGFVAGFYLMAAFMIITIINLCVIHIPQAQISNNICGDISKILSSKEILVFAFGIAFIGFFQSIIAVYEFWFLEDMGASRTLLGLSATMQCLVGEVPFLFFSGWFVKKLGHFLCFASVFAGFTIRLMLYSVLQVPWVALPIDALHGVTFGLYHGAMVSFAKAKAPKGMEATLLGLFAGLADGFGNFFGSFLGGFGIDQLGERTMFFTASMISMSCLLLFLVASYVFRTSAKIIKPSAKEMEEIASNQ